MSIFLAVKVLLDPCFFLWYIGLVFPCIVVVATAAVAITLVAAMAHKVRVSRTLDQVSADWSTMFWR